MLFWKVSGFIIPLVMGQLSFSLLHSANNFFIILELLRQIFLNNNSSNNGNGNSTSNRRNSISTSTTSLKKTITNNKNSKPNHPTPLSPSIILSLQSTSKLQLVSSKDSTPINPISNKNSNSNNNNNKSNNQTWMEDILYLIALGYHRIGNSIQSRYYTDQLLTLNPSSKDALILSSLIEDQVSSSPNYILLYYYNISFLSLLILQILFCFSIVYSTR